MNNFEVAFLGVTGSCSYNNGSRAKHGSNTLCVAVKAADETLIFDMGTGVCGLSSLEGYQTEKMNVFFSHYHLDHVCGILFCKELFDGGKSLDIYGPCTEGTGPDEFFKSFLSHPLHPIGVDKLNAKLKFNTIKAGDAISLPGDVKVSSYLLSHPGGSLGYRVRFGDKSVCYISDVELKNHEGNPELPGFMKDTDILILDCFFGGETIPGWGHSNFGECALWAKRAGAKKLVLFHLDHLATDAQIAGMESKARGIFPETLAAYDGLRISV